jgi:hypothetical protein
MQDTGTVDDTKLEEEIDKSDTNIPTSALIFSQTFLSLNCKDPAILIRTFLHCAVLY